MSRVFSNTTSLMTSVCMLYVGAMAVSSYLSLYADKLLKGEKPVYFLPASAQYNSGFMKIPVPSPEFRGKPL